MPELTDLHYPSVTDLLPTRTTFPNSEPNSVIELRTLGVLEIRRSVDGERDPIPLQTKRIALLAYLALSPLRQLRRRDSVLGLFWPELDQEHARGALRQALHALRRALGRDAIFVRGEEEIGVDPAVVRSDVEVMESALRDGRPADALAVYGGDFLEGVFIVDAATELEEWMATERVRLRRLAARAAWSAAARGAERGTTGEFVRRAVALSGVDERALRRGLEVLDRLGDRAGAVELYAEFAQRVRRDLGVEPSPETQAVVQAIRVRPGQ